MKRRTLLVLLCGLIGCISAPHVGTSMQLDFNADAMKRELALRIPVGTPIGEARRLLEENGFKCEEPYSPKVACLRGMLAYQSHFLTCDEIYVNIYHEAGVVQKIDVDCHTVGP